MRPVPAAGPSRRLSTAVAILPALLAIFLAILHPAEIYPGSRIALALLIPLAVLCAASAASLHAGRYGREGYLQALAGPAPWIIGFACFLAINAGVAVSMNPALLAAGRMAAAAALFLAVRWVARSDRDEAVVRVSLTLAMGGCLTALVALWQRMFGFTEFATDLRHSGNGVLLPSGLRDAAIARLESGRAFGTLMLPASLAGLLAITIPVTLALFFRSLDKARLEGGAAGGHPEHDDGKALRLVLSPVRSRVKLVLLAGGMLLQAAAFVASGSFGGFAALGVAGVLTIWCVGGRFGRRAIASAAVVAAAIGLVALFVRLRGFSPANLSDPANPIALRFGNWVAGCRMIAERPFLGAGGGSYGVLFPQFRTAGMNESRHAHNVYIELVVDYGIFVVPVVLLFAARAVLVWRRACASGRANAAGAIGIVAFLIHNAGDFTLYQPAVLLPFAALLGVHWDPGRDGDREAAGAGVGDGGSESGARRRAVGTLTRGRSARTSAIVMAGLVIASFATLDLQSAFDGVAGIYGEKAGDARARGDEGDAVRLLGRAAAFNPLDARYPSEAASLLLARVARVARVARDARAMPAPGQAPIAQPSPSTQLEAAFDLAGTALESDPHVAALHALAGTIRVQRGALVPAYVGYRRASSLYPLEPEYRDAAHAIEEKLKGTPRPEQQGGAPSGGGS